MTVAAFRADPPSQVVRPNRRKVAILLVVGIFFGIVALVMATSATASPFNRVIGAVGVVMFGFGSVIMAFQLGRDVPRLVLTQEGLRIYHWRGSRSYTWNEVGRLRPVAGTFGWTSIRLSRVPPARSFIASGSEARMISPYVYGMSAIDLANLLNTWRDHYLSRH